MTFFNVSKTARFLYHICFSNTCIDRYRKKKKFLVSLSKLKADIEHRLENAEETEKKSMAEVWHDMVYIITEKHRNVEWMGGAAVLVNDYFEDRLYRKGISVDDYMLDHEVKYLLWYMGEENHAIYDICRSKQLTANYLNKRGFSVPCELGVISLRGEEIRCVSETRNESFASLMRQEGEIFIKPDDGWEGRGCAKIRYDAEQGLFFLNDEPFPEEKHQSFFETPMIAQRIIRQHPTMAQLNNDTINTLRLITLRDNAGHVAYYSGVLRMGRKNGVCDNWASGGVAAGIHRDGSLSRLAYAADESVPAMEKHPDSGVTFADFVIPQFESCIQAAVKAHEQLPGMLSVGWDIVVTEQEPLIIEANIACCTFQLLTGGIRKLMEETYLPLCYAMAKKRPSFKW